MYIVESIKWIVTSRENQGGVSKVMVWICQDLIAQWGQ